mgnify:CR=1 FL=1
MSGITNVTLEYTSITEQELDLNRWFLKCTNLTAICTSFTG